MNTKQREMAKFVVKELKHFYGKSCTVTVSEKDNKVIFEVAGKDSGNDLMTFADIAFLLNTDVKVVRRLNRARARSTAQFPFPQPLKLGKEITRFRRSEILGWIEQHKTAGVSLPFRNNV
jgi:hypothetical protein